MIFSVLQKIEQGDRALGDRELVLLLPYMDRPQLKDLLDTKLLLRLSRLVAHDREWTEAVGMRMAYDVLFGASSSRVLDGMLQELLSKPGSSAYELTFALERAAQEGDSARLRRVTNILARIPDDDDGLSALSQAVMFNGDRALWLAAVAGNRANMRHLLYCVLKPGRDRAPVDAAAWMMEDNRMARLASYAAGESGGHQDTLEMILDMARRAGVGAQVLHVSIGLGIYYAAKSGDAVRLQRLWRRGMDVLGAKAMAQVLMRQSGEILTALALEADGRSLGGVLRLAERDLDKSSMTGVVMAAGLSAYGSTASIAALLNTARRTGGQELVDSLLRAHGYQMFMVAGARDNIDSLAVLEGHSSGETFMREMLKDMFLNNFIAQSSVPCLEYMVTRAHRLCGNKPLSLMLLALGREPVASRSDFMSVMNAIKDIPCLRNSGLDVAVPLKVIDAIKAHGRKDMPTHEFWQRVGGGEERWQAVANRPAPQGINKFSSPWQFKPKLFEEILPHIKRMTALEGLREGAAEQVAYRYAVMFANLAEAERYIEQSVRRVRPDGKKLPFYEASEFNVPGRGVWNVPHWRNLMMRYGPAAGRFVVRAPLIEEYCAEKNIALPRNVAEIMDVARFVVYSDAERHPEFARLALEHGLSQALFTRGLGILQRGKTVDAMPVVTIDGADIGKPNYYMQKLPANDPRGLVLGHIVNNCQSIGNNGEYAAIDGMTQPDSGFYVWRQKTKGQMTPDDRIVAQSWAWLAPGREGLRLVFDSYERLSPVYNHLARPFLEQYAHETTSKGPLSAIFLGAGGGTPPDLGLKQADVPAVPPSPGPARPDSARQYAIAPVNHRKPG